MQILSKSTTLLFCSHVKNPLVLSTFYCELLRSFKCSFKPMSGTVGKMGERSGKKDQGGWKKAQGLTRKVKSMGVRKKVNLSFSPSLSLCNLMWSVVVFLYVFYSIKQAKTQTWNIALKPSELPWRQI